jgi:preprotein translocase subunit SecD
MRRRLTGSLVAILVVAFGGLIVSVAAGNTPALGLDLQGGISVTQQPVGEYDPAALDLAVDRIRERVDSLGVAEPEIIRQGDAIVVNLPGVKNQQDAIDLVQVTGQVYLRPVLGCSSAPTDTSSTSTTVPGGDSAATTTVAGGDSATTVAPATTASPGPSRRVSPAASSVPPSTEPVSADAGATGTTVAAEPTSATPTPESTTPDTTVPSDTTPEITVPAPAVVSDPTQQQLLPLRGGGQCLVGPAGGSGAVFQNDATADIIGGGWGVRVGLRDGADGRDVWNQLAAQCVSGAATCPSRQLAIELDGEIISAPTVETANFTTGVQITGQFSEAEAKDLARVLRSGSLPVRMVTQSVQNVSPTLGKDSLNAALVAGLVGIILVLLLLVLYYRHLGLVVALGITVSGSILYSIISLLSRTQGLALSLAGVAGIIVSVGVTVDSYVVFFERLKDEVRNGRSLRNSAQRGFAGAWRTILIADTVSLIGAFTLWYLTVGAVRNFAFFLGLSTLIDLVVSYFFTRPAVLLLAGTDWMAKRKVMGIEVAASPSTPVARSAS